MDCTVVGWEEREYIDYFTFMYSKYIIMNFVFRTVSFTFNKYLLKLTVHLFNKSTKSGSTNRLILIPVCKLIIIIKH